MIRWLLVPSLLVCLAAPALAQPDDGLGLPGGPVFPPATPAPQPNPNAGLGKAIAGYLASLVDAGRVEAGAWYSLRGAGPGYMARITTRKWEAAINNGVEGTEPRQHLFTFEDLIGERVILEVERRGERAGALESSDTEVRAGVRNPGFDGDLLLEGQVWKDEGADVDVQKYRALLRALNPDPKDPTFVTVRVGVEGAQLNEVSALRMTGGVRFEAGNEVTKPSDIAVRFYADVEVAVGGYMTEGPGGDNEVGLSHSYRGIVGLGIFNERAGISLEHDHRAEVTGLGDRLLTRSVSRVSGFLTLDSQQRFQINGWFGLETINNKFDPLAPLPPSVLRPRGGLGLSYAPWADAGNPNRGPSLNLGVEVREELDGTVDNRVMGTITIPWDFP